MSSPDTPKKSYAAYCMDPTLHTDEAFSPTLPRYQRFLSSSPSRRSNSSLPLSILTDFSTNENLGCSGLSFSSDDYLPMSPESIRSLGKPYPTRGRSRYIIEPHVTFTFWSWRGWLNLGFVVILTVTLIALFAIWPVYAYIQNRIQAEHISSQSDSITTSGVSER